MATLLSKIPKAFRAMADNKYWRRWRGATGKGVLVDEKDAQGRFKAWPRKTLFCQNTGS